MLEVRGTEEDEGCSVEEEAEGSRMGKLVLLSVMVVSWAPRESGGGTSPRLDTRLSRERVRVDLERLCWLPALLLLVTESLGCAVALWALCINQKFTTCHSRH